MITYKPSADGGCQSGTSTTCDTLFAGQLTCAQPQQGYRFSIDAVLLAHFAAPRSTDRVLDLGAGCGVVSLILSYRYPTVQLTCLELQDSLVDAIRCNITANHLGSRITLVPGDLRQIATLLPAGSFDQVVCNPPYYPVGRGRQNLGAEQSVARHELAATLDDVVAAAAFALRTKGRLAMVYPAHRGAALITALQGRKLTPKRLQPVYPYPGGAEATLLLVEAIKAGGEGLTILPPLYIHTQPGGEYSATVASYYTENGQAPRISR